MVEVAVKTHNGDLIYIVSFLFEATVVLHQNLDY
jgi:hypothetical protein